MILGDPKVGKTALKHCCLGVQPSKTSNEDVFEKTHFTFYKCDVEVLDLQQPMYYDQVPTSVFEGVQGVILVYDIGRLGTFHNLVNWLDRIRAVEMIDDSIDNPIPVVIVGNKVDLRHWSTDVIKAREAVDLIEKLSDLYGRKIPYFEVSSYRTKITKRVSTKLMELVCEDFDQKRTVAVGV
jgi:GTPase SAR1 family protein